MPKLSEWQPGSRIRALVYAPAKHGKTFGAGTFPRPNFIDFDHGIATLRSPDFVRRWGQREVFYEQFSERSTTKSGVVIAANAFDDACRYFDEWMKPTGTWKGQPTSVDMFDTWVIDSGTTLSEYAMNKAIVLLGGKDLGIASATHKLAVNTGLVFPKMQDYGSERSLTEQFVQMVLDSGKHVILLCHEKEVTSQSGTLTAITPLLTGKGVHAVALKFDELYRIRVQRQGA